MLTPLNEGVFNFFFSFFYMDLVNKFCEENNLLLGEKIAKGWTSFIYTAENKFGKKFILKVLREKSNRKEMVKKESEYLLLANSVKVGPKFVKADFEKNIVMYEYVDGIFMSDWIFECNNKKLLLKFLKEIFSQTKKLDELGLDHGQLAGAGKNVLVEKGKPVIIDFEKASTKRKVHNSSILESYFFRNPNSVIVKKIKEILGADFSKNKKFV